MYNNIIDPYHTGGTVGLPNYTKASCSVRGAYYTLRDGRVGKSKDYNTKLYEKNTINSSPCAVYVLRERAGRREGGRQ